MEFIILVPSLRRYKQACFVLLAEESSPVIGATVRALFGQRPRQKREGIGTDQAKTARLKIWNKNEDRGHDVTSSNYKVLDLHPASIRL